MKFIREDIEKQLNPKLWEDNKLKKDVKTACLNIVEKFKKGLNKINIPLNVVDVWLVGSNASYNYNEFSDMDLHIIVDMDNMNSPELLQTIYDYYKSSFNDKYNITIKGIEVEMYVQSKDSSLISKGIYSILEDRWIKKPEYEEIKDIDIALPLEFMIKKFNEIKTLNNKDKAQSFLDTLYLNRARSLTLEGEYGQDNLIFKEFRNKGFIQDLKDIIINGESAELSLEGLVDKLNEDYLDPEERHYDYGTDKVEEITPENFFTTKQTGFSFYDDFLDPSQEDYLKKQKNLVGRVEYMTPADYFKYSAQLIGGTPKTRYEHAINDKVAMDDLREVVHKYKRQINLPYLNFSHGDYGPGQEGNHRMALAVELFGWNIKLPVLCVYTYDNNRE